MLLDRHRIAKLAELSAWERSVKGPERAVREEDVALLIKAAFADATQEAREEFMERVRAYPTSAWPWSAVEAASATHSRGGASNVGGLSTSLLNTASAPVLLILIRGQAESADVDPGNRLPPRSAVEAPEWEALHVALDSWDTAALRQWIGPLGWVSPSGTMAGASETTSASGDASNEATNGGSTENGRDLPVSQSALTIVPVWRQPTVLAAGAVVLVATGVTVYVLTRPGDQARLEAELLRRQREAQ